MKLNITGILIKSGINYLLILLHFVSFGQNSTYLGIEIGPKFEVYKSTDNGNGLYTKPFSLDLYGLTIGQKSIIHLLSKLDFSSMITEKVSN